MAWVAATAAAISAAGAIVNNMQQRSELTFMLEKYGADMAAADANAYREQEQLSGQASAVQQTAQQQRLLVEQNQAATQAQMEVAAAAAGVEGVSVDTTMAQTDISSAMAINAVDNQEANAMTQIEQRSRDIALNRASQDYDLDVSNAMGGALLNVFNAGLRGFLGGR